MDWMDANRAVKRDREVLKRILALLIALAAVADRLAGLPFHVRLSVLRHLRPAEAVARAFIIEMAHDLGAPTSPQEFDMPASVEDGDAAGLAQRFRALALVLTYMLSCPVTAGVQDGYFVTAGARKEGLHATAQKLNHAAQTGRRGQHRPEPRAHDTS